MRPPAGWFGWGGLVLAAAVGGATSGAGGLLVMAGLYVLVVAVVAIIRGRIGWARLRGRAAGGLAFGTALALMIAGSAIADPPPDEPAAAPTTAPTEAPTPTPRPTREPAPTPSPSARQGSVLTAAASLTVKGRAPKTGYDRALFGQAWFDADRNGCDTRNDILRRDLDARDMKNYCKVLAGTLNPDPYTGTEIRFEYGGASEVDIDHVVALGDAWQKAAATWSAGKRLAFANDPLNLLAVDAGANRSKGDGDTATWLPPSTSFRCTYVARQVAVKTKYEVWVTAAERDAMVRVLSTCTNAAAPAPGPAPTEAALPRSAQHKAPTSVAYENCTAVRAAGADPIRAGQPGYSRKLDRDGDGVGCE